MNPTQRTILVGFFIFLLYFIALNVYVSIPINETEEQISNSTSGQNTQISLSSSLSVQVIKHRWYGVIIADDGTESLHLFNMIKIPLKNRGLNLMLIHIPFIVISILILILLNKKWRKSNKDNTQLNI